MIRARGIAELSMQSLADAVGLSLLQIPRIEGGHRVPSVAAFAALHRVLAFDANVLLDGLCERPATSSREPFGSFGAIVQATREALGVPAVQVARVDSFAGG